MNTTNEGGPASPAPMPQACFRITRKQKKRLARLGVLERRKLPNIFRLSLSHSLDVWDATHPAKKDKIRP